MPIRVRWEGAFFSNHSLALVNREIVSRLGEDLQVAICSGENRDAGSWDRELVQKLRGMETRSDVPVDVCVRHRFPPRLERPSARRWVQMQPWEYGPVPREWYGPMRDEIDEIWVYSSFNRQCYVECGIPEEKVHVVPLGVQSSMLGPARPFPLRTRKRFRFLFVGGTILRKGIDRLLEAYLREFGPQDDVCLVVKDFLTGSFYRDQTSGDFIRAQQTISGSPEIEYLTEELTPEALRDLYHSCDCLVHPYRGEGFGLPIAEAMACGLPVIVPDQGGASDFCTPETAILLPSRRAPIDFPGAAKIDAVGPLWWLETSASDLRDRMREVYENPESVRPLAERGKRLVRERFTWERAAAVASDRITALHGESVERDGDGRARETVCRDDIPRERNGVNNDRTLDLSEILHGMVESGHTNGALAAVESAVAVLTGSRPDGDFEVEDLLTELQRSGEGKAADALSAAIESVIRKSQRDRLVVAPEIRRLYRASSRPGADASSRLRPEYSSLKELYHRVAHGFEGSYDHRKALYRHVADLIQPGERVVDIGCGDGLFLELVRERGAHGVGIDMDPEKIDVLRSKGLEGHCGRAQDLDWSWGPTDFISMLHIVEHIPPAELFEILHHACGCLSDRGRLFMLTPNIALPQVQINFWLDITHVRPYPEPLLHNVARTLGFPHVQSGSMFHEMDAWAYGFQHVEDAIPH